MSLPNNILVEIAEDCPVSRAVAPPDGPTISRIEYETLKEKPYKFTEREFFYEVHAVRRNMTNLHINAYLLQRSELPKRFGWGIHVNDQGKLGLVEMESPLYKKLKETISTVKAYRTNRA